MNHPADENNRQINASGAQPASEHVDITCDSNVAGRPLDKEENYTRRMGDSYGKENIRICITLPGAADGRDGNSVVKKLRNHFASENRIVFRENEQAFHKDARGYLSSPQLDSRMPRYRIGMFNAMPNAVTTDLTIARRTVEAMKWALDRGYIDNSIEIEFVPVRPSSIKTGLPESEALNDEVYTDNFHQNLSKTDCNELCVDSWIVTGAQPFEDDLHRELFYPEMQQVLHHIKKKSAPAMIKCLGAQGYFDEFYDVGRYKREEKAFGLYKHKIEDPQSCLLRGVAGIDNGEMLMPLSRRWQSCDDKLAQVVRENESLVVVTSCPEGGPSVVIDGNKIVLSSHPEYEPDTLLREYLRDKDLDPNASQPKGYNVDNPEIHEGDFSYQPAFFYNSLTFLFKSNNQQLSEHIDMKLGQAEGAPVPSRKYDEAQRLPNHPVAKVS